MDISAAAYPKYYALFDKSTKIGTHVDYHLINVFGYGGDHQCTHGDHGKKLKNGGHVVDLKPLSAFNEMLIFLNDSNSWVMLNIIYSTEILYQLKYCSAHCVGGMI